MITSGLAAICGGTGAGVSADGPQPARDTKTNTEANSGVRGEIIKSSRDFRALEYQKAPDSAKSL
jgi:hypothetical protein